MKRMYGEFDMTPPDGTSTKRKRSTKPGVPDIHFDPGPDEVFPHKIRTIRQNFRNNQSSETGR